MTERPDTLEVALAYAARGYRVLPLCRPVAREDGVLLTDGDGHIACTHALRKEKCGRDKKPDPGKIPLSHLTPRGVLDATTDPEVIRGWWAKAGGPLNWGIAAGPTLLILDEDTYKHEHAWEELRDACGGADLDTVVFMTGGGGRHHLYRVPADSGLTQAPPKVGGKPIRGIDVRVGNGYIVGPGSLHKSGKLYTAELSCDPLEGAEPREAHAALVALLRGGEASAAARPTAQPIVDGETVPVGKRKYTITQLAGGMHMRGLSEEAIIAAIRAENEAGRFAEAIEDAELVRAVKTVTKKPRDGRKKAAAAPADPPAAHAPPMVPPAPPAGEGNGGNPPAEGANGDAAAPRRREGLTRGDATELADRLLVDLKGNSPVAVVYDRGKFWRYDQNRGIYVSVTYPRAVKTVRAYAGRIVNDGEDAHPLKLSMRQIKDVVELAGQIASPDAELIDGETSTGFFDDAVQGVAFSNCFVRIDKPGVVVAVPHSHEHRARHGLPYEYAPFNKDHPPKAWVEFFDAVFLHADEKDRNLRVMLLLQLVGACLFGIATDFCVAGVLLGEGSNGKSTFLKMVTKLFPPGSVTSIAPQDWSNSFKRVALSRSLLNHVAELPENEMMSSTTFKGIVGGDDVMAEYKGKDVFQFKPKAGHLFAANALPPTRDISRGFWRRWAIVAFDREFTEKDRDLGVVDRLSKELGELASWIVDCTATLVKDRKYKQPASSVEALAKWQMDTDQVAQFVEAALEPLESSETKDGQDASKIKDGPRPRELYSAYVLWAKANGHSPMNSHKFKHRIESHIGKPSKSDGNFHFARKIKSEYSALPESPNDVRRGHRQPDNNGKSPNPN